MNAIDPFNDPSLITYMPLLFHSLIYNTHLQFHLRGKQNAIILLPLSQNLLSVCLNNIWIQAGLRNRYASRRKVNHI